MFELRYYQQDAVQSIFDWFRDGNEHPLIELPTGTGKSLVIAEICRRILNDYPPANIIIATHVKELVKQNHDELKGLWDFSGIGIFSAGLKRKDFRKQITFAGIQSIYKHAANLRKIDILIIDEAHTLPHGTYGRWHKFIKELTDINPNMQVIGLTATPYRMDSGHLCEGDDSLFRGISYSYNILEAINDGYLCPIIPKPVSTRYNLKGVGTLGGEYRQDQLEKIIDTDELNKKAVDEILDIGKDRKSWLVFGTGNSHAKHINDLLVNAGIKSAVITQETPREDRDAWIHQFKTGHIKCIVNNMILTTGFNAPNVDLIACLRPTKSAGLWVQICGRGMRLSPEKQDCLMLDFGKNTDRHGQIDQIKAKKTKGDGSGEAPMKKCPSCKADVFAGCSVCPDCGFEFPPPELKIEKTASTKALLSTQVEPSIPEWFDVDDVKYSRHKGKDEKPDTLKVIYYCGIQMIKEYICLDHPDDSYAFQKAVQWARKRGMHSDEPIFYSIDDALDFELDAPIRIKAKLDGKYWRVLDYIFA